MNAGPDMPAIEEGAVPSDDPVVIELPDTVSAVVLDVGGVLVVPHPEVVREQLADIVDLDIVGDDDFVTAHYRGMEALDRAEDTEDHWEQYHRAYLAQIGVAATDEALGHLRDLWSVPSDDLWCYSLAHNVKGLRSLVTAGVPVAIVSNADGRVAVLLRNLAIAQEGEGPGTEVAIIVDSHIVGVAKPDPAIFTPAIEALGLSPASCVYVGDSERFDVAGARAAGLHAMLMVPEPRTTASEVTCVSSLLDLAAALI